MNPGRLDRQLKLLTRTVGTDSAGAPVSTWAASGTIYGQKMALTASEKAAEQGSDRAQQSLVFLIRWMPALEMISAPGTYRVTYAGRNWDVTGCPEDISQRRRAFMLLSLAATEGEPTLTAIPALP